LRPRPFRTKRYSYTRGVHHVARQGPKWRLLDAKEAPG
jgi:hypothetical protein